MTQATNWGLAESGPQTPIAYSQHGNESFDSLLSLHLGTSRPAYAVQGTLWLKDTGVSPAVHELYLFDGVNDVLLGTLDVATSSFTPISLLISANLSDVASAPTALSNIGGVGPATTDTLTNKTINGGSNTLENIQDSSRADGTDGALSSWDAAGAPTIITPGTDGFYFRSGGPGALPVWEQRKGVLQSIYDVYTAVHSHGNNIPSTTIPQITEGAQVFSQAITPKSSSSKIIVDYGGPIGGSANDYVAMALFYNGGSNAVSVAPSYLSSSNRIENVSGRYEIASWGTTSRTFNVRYGTSSGTAYANTDGNTSPTALFGQKANMFLRIHEVLQ